MSEETISAQEYRDVLTLMGHLEDAEGKLLNPLVLFVMRDSLPLGEVLDFLESQGIDRGRFVAILRGEEG